MTIKLYSYIIACVVGISFGQVLFKYAAILFKEAKSILYLPFLAYLTTALIVYGISASLWVYILQFVPLSRAYPFVAICFILVPAAGWLIFGEKLDLRYLIGIIFICIGVVLAGK